MRKLYWKFRQWQTRRQLMRFEPKMISNYKLNGEIIHFTRVSSSTVISEKQHLKLAGYIFIGHYNFIEASNGIQIDEGVQITNYCSILSHSSHVSIRLYGRAYVFERNLIGYKTGPVTIGAYTFIGPHSTIMPGASIGKGCIVAAYSSVKGEFPDFSIIAGNPAVVVGNTQEMDAPFLAENPELQMFYNSWAK
jgi:acetyltransferase-like isoleucine patch superfamily enzyme